MAKQSTKSSGCTGKRGRGKPRTKTPAVYTKTQLRQIDAWAEAQCKDTTIAEALGVDVKAFQREFAKRTRQKRARGKACVLASQYKQALANATSAIWWGKQHLEQSDRADVAIRELPPITVRIMRADDGIAAIHADSER